MKRFSEKICFWKATHNTSLQRSVQVNERKGRRLTASLSRIQNFSWKGGGGGGFIKTPQKKIYRFYNLVNTVSKTDIRDFSRRRVTTHCWERMWEQTDALTTQRYITPNSGQKHTAVGRPRARTPLLIAHRLPRSEWRRQDRISHRPSVRCLAGRILLHPLSGQSSWRGPNRKRFFTTHEIQNSWRLIVLHKMRSINS